MALDEIGLNWATQAMPGGAAAALIEDAQDRTERFIQARQTPEPIPSFVACDFVMVDRALREIVDHRLSPGMVFCEWGAGFAVAAGLASLNGFAAHAIEIHRDLVEQAERLLRDHGLEVELAQGSLVPEGGDEIVDEMASQDWLKTNEHPAYNELGIEVSDIDLIFAYPWPGEEGLIEALFDTFAAEGALLLTYHGMNEMKLQRKTQGDSFD